MPLTMLRDGRIHLSGIAMLAPLLTRTNRNELLKRATHKSKRELRELIAELRPNPDAPSVMRKLPAHRKGAPEPALRSSDAEVFGPGIAEHRPSDVGPATSHHDTLLRAEHRPDDVKKIDTGPAPHSVRPPSASPPRLPRPTTVEPLAPARYKIQFTADAKSAVNWNGFRP